VGEEQPAVTPAVEPEQPVTLPPPDATPEFAAALEMLARGSAMQAPKIVAPKPHRREEAYLKALLYGLQGSGKTTFGASAEEIGDVAFTNVESGMLSVQPSDRILRFDLNEYIPDPDHPWHNRNRLDRMEDIIWMLAGRNYHVNPWLEPVKTLVLDSGTEFLNLGTEDVVAAAMVGNKKRTDQYDVWVEDHGKVTKRLTSIFRKMREIPYNVVVTALVRTETTRPKGDESPIVLGYKPDFTPKVGNTIMGFFDHVWYSYKTVLNEATGEAMVSFLTQPVGLYFAKTRGTQFPIQLGLRVDNPSFANIYDLLQDTEGSPA
jgi:hypothetical protein